MEGTYRVRLDGRDLEEWFVAAPGPMGWRWFGRVRSPGSEEDLRLVDLTVDLSWELVRFRLMDLELGVEMMATAAPSGMAVSRAGADSGQWLVDEADAVWSGSPGSLLVLDRLARASGASGLTAAVLDAREAPRPASVRLTEEEGATSRPPGDRRVTVHLDERRFDVVFRDDWPASAKGWFELRS